MQAGSSIVPAISVGLLTLLSALPWGLPSEVRFVLPLIPLAAVHYWIIRDDRRISEWFVFLSGLTLDVLTNGPLGYWCLMYLAAYALSALLAGRARAYAFGGWAALVMVVSFLAAAVWALSSLYAFEIADWRPLAVASLAAAGIYPFIALLLRLVEPSDGVRAPAGHGGASK